MEHFNEMQREQAVFRQGVLFGVLSTLAVFGLIMIASS